MKFLSFWMIGLSLLGQVAVLDAAPLPLSEYQNPTANTPLTSLSNLSGITYNWVANEYVTVHQNRYCRLDDAFNELFCGSLACGDCEDISFIGINGGFYEYAIVEEGGAEGSVYILQSPIATHNLRLDQIDVQTLTYAPTAGGDSGEGVAYDAENKIFYVCIEDPDMQVLAFARPMHSNDLSYANGSLTVSEVLTAAQLNAVLGSGADLSSCYFNQATGRLLLMSHLANTIIDIDLAGNLVDQLLLPTGQVEGFTFNLGFDQLIVVKEPREYQRYFANGGIFSDSFE